MEVHLTGGSAGSWRKMIFKVDSLIDVEKSLAGGVIFYPHLSGKDLVRRSVYPRSLYRAEYGTDRSDMLYAVIEGLCFSFRELAEKMRLPLCRFGSVKGGRRRLKEQSVDADSGQCAEYPY